MDYIYINEYAISQELCADMIELFEKSNKRYEGITAGGLNKNVKDTSDLMMDKNDKTWKDIYIFLKEELTLNLNKYLDKINSKYESHMFELFDRNIEISNFMMQRYLQNIGKYTYHNDFSVDHQQQKYRVLTYLFYLNDVEEGGETELLNDIKIKPKAGKLLLFPATWTFPHRGIMPISSNKYIITGWIYNFRK